MEESNYAAAARLVRACKTMEELEARDRANHNLYNNGCLTSSELHRLSAVEMEKFAELKLKEDENLSKN